MRSPRIPAPTFAEEPRIAWLQRAARACAAASPRRGRQPDLGWGAGRPGCWSPRTSTPCSRSAPTCRLERDGHDLVGPGVGDNAAAVAVTLAVVGDLLGRDDVRPGAVAFTVGEEGSATWRRDGRVRRARSARLRRGRGPHARRRSASMPSAACAHVSRRAAPGGHSWYDRVAPQRDPRLCPPARSGSAVSTRRRPVNVGLVDGRPVGQHDRRPAEMVIERRAIDQRDLDHFSATLEELAVPAASSRSR